MVEVVNLAIAPKKIIAKVCYRNLFLLAPYRQAVSASRKSSAHVVAVVRATTVNSLRCRSCLSASSILKRNRVSF